MIDKEEIYFKADQMEVHVANVERDYVFGWLIRAFYENDYLAELLVFKGGNCMRKAYFPETRFSSDLDFSVQTKIDIDSFLEEINKSCRDAELKCGVKFDTGKNTLKADRMIDDKRQSFKGRIYFQDFQGNQDHVTISIRLDITEFERIYLPTVMRKLIHPYSDKDKFDIEIQCMALEELIANKLKCLIQRRHSYDLYDLVYATFIDKSVEIDRSAVLNTFLQKTIFESNPGSVKNILLGIPMDFFKAAWAKYVSPVAGRFEFDIAEKGFRTAIENIFEGILSSDWGHQAFFPAEYRNLILEAGSSRKLMKMTYGGYEREIEPYALSYKRARNKHATEYFYAYDRTGGSSGQASIKSFLHGKIEQL